MIRFYFRFWIFLTILLSFESLALNYFPEFGVIGTLKYMFGLFPKMSLDPTPGKSISLFLGWTGLGIMILTNIYVLKKRFFMDRGKLSNWLDFHILCGLVGPTLILFHTNFKIGGLVAISFWSMVISFLSGIIGRYFYLQITSHKSELEKSIKFHKNEFSRTSKLPEEQISKITNLTFKLACIPAEAHRVGIVGSLFRSIWGDIKMSLYFPKIEQDVGEIPSHHLRSVTLLSRKWSFWEQFRKLMGYWHSFHMPFAVFMYLVAAIHVLTVLLLRAGSTS